MFTELISDLTFSLCFSPAPAQLAGVVFLGVGLWAWSEKVGVTIIGTLSSSHQVHSALIVLSSLKSPSCAGQ